MAGKKGEKKPVKKLAKRNVIAKQKMCDQCELTGGFPRAGSEKLEFYAEYRVQNVQTGFEIFLCEQHRKLLLPRAHKLPSGRWAVEGRISELL